MIGLSHGGTTIYASDPPSDEALVGTTDGVVKLRRDGERWPVVGHSLAGKHIHALLFVDSTILAGAWWDGVYASQDGGETWEARDAGIDVRSLFSLAAVDREGGKAAVRRDRAPRTSTTATTRGMTWTELPEVRSVASVPRWRFAADPFEAHLKHINFHPNDPAHLYVSIEVGGLLESIDGGETWADIEVPNPRRSPHRHRPSQPVRPVDHRRRGTAAERGRREVVAGAVRQGERHRRLPPTSWCIFPATRTPCTCPLRRRGPRSWVREGSGEGFAGGRIAKSADGGRSWAVLTGRAAGPPARERRGDVPRRGGRKRPTVRGYDRRRGLVDGRRRRDLEQDRAARPGVEVGAHRDADRRPDPRLAVLRRRAGREDGVAFRLAQGDERAMLPRKLRRDRSL